MPLISVRVAALSMSLQIKSQRRDTFNLAFPIILWYAQFVKKNARYNFLQQGTSFMAYTHPYSITTLLLMPVPA
jgi:hypothetical protein